MSFFNVKFNKVVKDNLPVRLRKPGLLAFFSGAVGEIKELYRKFQIEWQKIQYKINRTQHLVHLEAVLNDTFDVAFRRIKVENSPVVYLPTYIFQDAENKPVPIYTDAENKPEPLYTDYEIENEGIDFKILINHTIPYDLAQLIALVDYFKVPGTNYIIEETL